jgi:hypothetical protein
MEEEAQNLSTEHELSEEVQHPDLEEKKPNND